jgi:hypothetical protein
MARSVMANLHYLVVSVLCTDQSWSDVGKSGFLLKFDSNLNLSVSACKNWSFVTGQIAKPFHKKDN